MAGDISGECGSLVEKGYSLSAGFVVCFWVIQLVTNEKDL